MYLHIFHEEGDLLQEMRQSLDITMPFTYIFLSARWPRYI